MKRRIYSSYHYRLRTSRGVLRHANDAALVKNKKALHPYWMQLKEYLREIPVVGQLVGYHGGMVLKEQRLRLESLEPKYN